jgi:plastocyanin
MTRHTFWGWLVLLAADATTASAAVLQVDINDYSFSPNIITIQAGDTVHWVNHMGNHTVTADDSSFRSGNIMSAPWTFDHTFTTAGEFPYYCENHGGPGQPVSGYNFYMNGKVVVQAAPPPFEINQGISGAWFNPATGGQGFLVDVYPTTHFMFIAWFTYDEAAALMSAAQPKVGSAEQRWLTLQGTYGAGGVAQLPIYLTKGGVFNTPQATNTTQAGTATVTFTSCTAGSIAYNLTSEGLTGTVPIVRGIPGSETLCQALAAPATPATATPADTPH